MLAELHDNTNMFEGRNTRQREATEGRPDVQSDVRKSILAVWDALMNLEKKIIEEQRRFKGFCLFQFPPIFPQKINTVADFSGKKMRRCFTRTFSSSLSFLYSDELLNRLYTWTDNLRLDETLP